MVGGLETAVHSFKKYHVTIAIDVIEDDTVWEKYTSERLIEKWFESDGLNIKKF
jgi:hypothetical protein